ncbi:hypothetical protein [Paenibacillus sp. NEAU-GSW1]|uniref:hypothetical protein n=1 Tax=Paenibacillus sp. NEAU-GSW1 TaxID=2682486 RepID=UPI0012E24395|nr:hypothetical protein [Paenibacillus sp. NEAU-GSW1]MUT66957.1 hypothetical protein [Paenibacillus sp. NEAU-GSW1]
MQLKLRDLTEENTSTSTEYTTPKYMTQMTDRQFRKRIIFHTSRENLCQGDRMMHKKIRQSAYPAFEALKRMEELEREIEEEIGKSFFDSIGISFDYWPEDENAEYDEENMPIDMVLLATTTVSECSFGFITEFSTIDDLANAPIVQYESIGLDKHATLIAHHFIDFLRLLITKKSVFGLMSEEDTASDVSPEDQYIYKRIMETFQIEPFASVQSYKQQLKADRAKNSVVDTYNGLGVSTLTGSTAHQRFVVPDGEDDEEIMALLTDFLKSSSLESKLAYIRDVQENSYIDIPSFEETDVLLIAELKRHGFVNEAKRMALITGNDD